MRRENPNLETPLSDDVGERKTSLENNNENDELSDPNEPTVSAKEMIEKFRNRDFNEKEENKNEDDELCKFDEYGEIIEEEGPMSEEKKRRIKEEANKILEKLEKNKN